MMGNRILRESICTSEDVNRMTDFQFRLWAHLLTYVDDFGRGDARPAVIKGRCFPLRDRITVKDIDAALRALAGIGCVSLYDVDGKPYLCFPTWESYQNVRNQKSKFPAPENSQSGEMFSIESTCSQLISIDSKCSRNPNPNPNPNPNNNYARAREEFDTYRRENGCALSAASWKSIDEELEKLAPGNDEMKAQILRQSILKGWKGVFPLKNGAPKKKMRVAEFTGNDDLGKLERAIGDNHV